VYHTTTVVVPGSIQPHSQEGYGFVMEWNHRKLRWMVHWDRKSNTGCIRYVPGTKHYMPFVADHDEQHDAYIHDHLTCNAHAIHNYCSEVGEGRIQSGPGQDQASEGGKQDEPPPLVFRKDEDKLLDLFVDSNTPAVVPSEESA
jgi:hypothetical protein